MELKQEEEQSPSEARTSKAQIDERDCEFGDHNCGEPLLAQRLLIDFTPDEELDLDSEYNQNKCRAFWDFIKSKPELQHLMAVPEAIEYGESFTLSEYQQSEPSPTPEPVDRTAVSTLELVQKEGQMAPAFQGMMPQSHCSLGSREYPEPIIGINKSKKKPHVCAGKPSSEICGRASRFDGRSAALAAAPRWKSLPAHAQSDPVAVDLCKNINKWDAEHPNCWPICKSRRREWKGIVQETSAELFLDQKPVSQCFRRCPTKVYPNSPCPLFGRTRRVTLVRRNSHLTPGVVRICQAPLDVFVDTTYLQYAALAKSIGAWDSVHASCAFCECGCCCGCARDAYEPRDAHGAAAARQDMRRYDARVVTTYQEMRTMYDM